MAQRAPSFLGLLPFALAVGLGLLYLGAEMYLFGRPAFPLDDAWIHLQLGRNLHAGHGMAYQAGEPVSASTAPLWTALISLGFFLPGGLPLLWPKILGLGLLITSLWALGRWADGLGLSIWGRLIAQLMLLLGPWWIWSALSGMEILLFSTLSLLALERRQRALLEIDSEHDPRTASVAALVWAACACLARPEGLLLWTLVLAEQALHPRLRNRLWLGGSASAMILAPTALYYQWIGGSPLPSTFAAKTASGDTAFDLAAFWSYLRLVLGFFIGSQPLMSLLACGMLAASILLFIKHRGRPVKRVLKLAVPALWLLGQPVAYGLIAARGGTPPMGNFGRYYFPLLPIVVLLAAAALEWATDGMSRRYNRRLPLWALLLPTILVTATQVGPALQGLPRYLQTVANVEDSDVRAALWMSRRLPPEARLAAQDIGAVKFFLPSHSLMDLAGLVDAEVREVLANDEPGSYWEERLARLARRRGVDFVLVFQSSYPGLTREGGSFRTVQEWTLQNNVTMAGSRLVLLRTPWSRMELRAPIREDHQPEKERP